MEKYKVGGKIILEDNTKYQIVDIINYNNKEYLFCCTTQKPIAPKLLEKKIEGDDVYIREVEDPRILKNVALKILK